MAKLIFDGDCGFCTQVAAFAKKHQSKNFETTPWQSIESELAEYKLNENDVMKRVYFVDTQNNVYGGAEAILQASRSLKIPYRCVSILRFIPARGFILEPLYNLIARNRARLPGSTDSCKLEDDS